MVAALLSVAKVTAGLVESNGSLLPSLWLMTAKNRDQLRNPTLGNQVLATFTFLACRKQWSDVHTANSV